MDSSSCGGSSSGAASVKDKKLQFPWKLHQVLDSAQEEGHADVISWTANGKAFKIFDKERFEAEVMPKKFSSNKFKSFQRNLNLWGFRVSQSGAGKGQCGHPQFVRGMPNLCFKMERTKVKVPGKRTKATQERLALRTKQQQQQQQMSGTLPRAGPRPTGTLAEAASVFSHAPHFLNQMEQLLPPTGSFRVGAAPGAHSSSSTGGSSPQQMMSSSNHSLSTLTMAGLLAAHSHNSNNQFSLVETLQRLATLERFKQEQQQQANNEAMINNALLVYSLLGGKNNNYSSAIPSAASSTTRRT